MLVTPYFTSKGDHTVALRYREAFSNGYLQLDGSASRDTIEPGKTRGYVGGLGNFALGNGFQLCR